jgi:hypothetical protein
MKWPKRVIAIGIIQLIALVLLGVAALAAGEEDGDGQARVGEPNVSNATVFIQREGEDEALVVSTDAAGFFVARNLSYGVYFVWAQDGESNLSAVQSVTLDEVNGASTVDLPISRNTSGGTQIRITNSIFLPLVNR